MVLDIWDWEFFIGNCLLWSLRIVMFVFFLGVRLLIKLFSFIVFVGVDVMVLMIFESGIFVEWMVWLKDSLNLVVFF